MKSVTATAVAALKYNFYRIFFIYPRFELETQVESMLVYLSFDLYIFALSSVFY